MRHVGYVDTQLNLTILLQSEHQEEEGLQPNNPVLPVHPSPNLPHGQGVIDVLTPLWVNAED